MTLVPEGLGMLEAPRHPSILPLTLLLRNPTGSLLCLLQSTFFSSFSFYPLQLLLHPARFYPPAAEIPLPDHLIGSPTRVIRAIANIFRV